MSTTIGSNGSNTNIGLGISPSASAVQYIQTTGHAFTSTTARTLYTSSSTPPHFVHISSDKCREVTAETPEEQAELESIARTSLLIDQEIERRVVLGVARAVNASVPPAALNSDGNYATSLDECSLDDIAKAIEHAIHRTVSAKVSSAVDSAIAMHQEAIRRTAERYSNYHEKESAISAEKLRAAYSYSTTSNTKYNP